ncbi:hypothetical protein [Nocardia sp. R6R-6]|uniref:hypothetical protein n=1 Tax=Nocardia sp. R6R-6 TaxID=3459303 RepID=UPI00403D76BF
MPKGHPDADSARAALALAVRARSVHNTQPWQWRVGDTTVHLYADDSRRLPHADPDRRDLIRADLLSDSGFPQLIVRIGWAATSAAQVPMTPRRALSDVVHPL